MQRIPKKYLNQRDILGIKAYVAKGGGEGGMTPPLAIVVLLWSPLLAWKIVSPLRVKKVGLYPP